MGAALPEARAAWLSGFPGRHKKSADLSGPRPLNDKGREGLVDQNAMFLAQYAPICCTSAGGNGT